MTTAVIAIVGALVYLVGAGVMWSIAPESWREHAPHSTDDVLPPAAWAGIFWPLALPPFLSAALTRRAIAYLKRPRVPRARVIRGKNREGP